MIRNQDYKFDQNSCDDQFTARLSLTKPKGSTCLQMMLLSDNEVTVKACDWLQARRRSRWCERRDDAQVLLLYPLGGRAAEEGASVLSLCPREWRRFSRWRLLCFPPAAGAALQTAGDVGDGHALLWRRVHGTEHHCYSSRQAWVWVLLWSSGCFITSLLMTRLFQWAVGTWRTLGRVLTSLSSLTPPAYESDRRPMMHHDGLP